MNTDTGWVYVAFFIDVFSRFIVGWQASTSLRSDLALDALEMAIYARNSRGLAVIHHLNLSNICGFATSSVSARQRSSRWLAPKVTFATVLAESFKGLYKTELIHRNGPWRNVEHVEWETLIYVDWLHHRRIHESLDYVRPVEF